ncbi:MAG: phage tail tape measure protein, partial [Desulfobulbaceae bacterium]|nr:phage tail tape measure protein [Desulfobulbaceae bacterium]
ESRLQAARAAYAADANSKTSAELKVAERGLASAEKAAAKYNITVAGAAKAHAEATAAIKKQAAALETMEKLQANKAKRAELRGEMMGTVAGFLAAGAPLKLAADYETAMVRVKRAAKFDAAAFADFKRQALALGGNLEDTGAIAAKGGVTVAQNELLHFTAVGKQMVKVFDITAEEAGEALGGIRTHFKLTEAQADAYLDTLSHLANNMRGASSTVLLEFSHRTADVGKQYGVSREQIAALGATMSGMQVPAKQAISATQGIFHALGQAGSAKGKAQAVFAQFGLRGKDIEQNFRKDAQGTMLKIFEHLQRYSGPMRMKLAEEIFGGSQANTVIKLVENLDEYKKAITLAGDATGSAGAFLADYKEVTGTVNAALTRLKTKAVQIGTAMGESNVPVVKWIANAGGGMLDTVFSLVTAFPAVTSTVVGLSTAMVGLSLATKAGKYGVTLFKDGWLITKTVLAKLPPLFRATTYQMLLQRGVALASAAAVRAMAIGQGILAVASKSTAATTWLLNTAMLANPITWIVVGVVALAAGMIWLYRTCEPVRTAISKVWDVLKFLGTNYLRVLLMPAAVAWNGLKTLWGLAAPYFKSVWGKVTGFFAAVWGGIKTKAVAIWESIAGGASTCVGAVKSFFAPITTFFSGIWDSIKAPAVAVFDWLSAKFDWVVAKLSLVTNAWSTVKGWTSWLDDDKEKAADKPMLAVSPSVPVSASAPAAAYLSGQAAASPTIAGTRTTRPGLPAAAPTGPDLQVQPTGPLSPVRPALVPASGGGASNVSIASPQIALSLNFNGVPSKDIGEVLVKAIKEKERDLSAYFEKMIASIASNQRRLAYDR